MTSAPGSPAHALEPTSAEIVAEARNIARMFQPHPHWTLSDSPLAFGNEVLLHIAVARLQGRVQLSSEPIQLHRLDDREVRPWSAPADPLEEPVWARRGGDLLKDETWSALRHLQSLHPGEDLQAFWRCLPFGWLHVASQTFVTAGNLEPDLAFEFMVENQIVKLGVAGPRRLPPSDGQAEPEGEGRQPFSMHWLRLDPRVLDELRSRREEQLAETVRALRTRRSGLGVDRAQ